LCLNRKPAQRHGYEQTLQSLIEQLDREYDVALEDMERDFRVALEIEDSHSGMIKVQRKTASLVVFEADTSHSQQNIIRVAMVAKSVTKPAAKKGIPELEEILGSLNDRQQIFGLWTNGSDFAFRMRIFHKRTGTPALTELTDFPAPARLVENPEAIRKAVIGPPALHRFIKKYPRWVVAAARRVLDHYNGDAGRIWNGNLTARQVEPARARR